MPSQAAQHSDEGAKAFVAYFWDVVTAARTAADSSYLSSLVDAHCDGCAGAVEAINDEQSSGAVVSGGRNSVTGMKVAGFAIGTLTARMVTCTVTTEEETEDYPGTVPDHVSPEATHKIRMAIIPTEAGWVVDRLDVLS